MAFVNPYDEPETTTPSVASSADSSGFVNPYDEEKPKGKKSEKSAAAAAEAVATFFPKMIAGGLQGGAEGVSSLASGTGAKAAGENLVGKFEDTMGTHLINPRSTELQQQFMHGIGKVVEALGAGAETAATDLRASTPGVNAMSDFMGLKKPAPDLEGAPGLRTGVEFATNFIPIGAAKKGRDAIVESGRKSAEAKVAKETAKKETFEFVNPYDEPSSIRNAPEDARFHETPLKPGEFISEDGRKLVQEPYEAGLQPKLEARETIGPRERGLELERPLEYKPDPDAVKFRPQNEFDNVRLYETLVGEYDKGNPLVAREGLKVIAEHSETKPYREIAELLLKDKDFNPTFRVSEHLEGKNLGEYDRGSHEIHMKTGYAGNEYVFLHESIHAATVNAIRGVMRGEMKHLEAPVKRLQELYADLKAQPHKLIDSNLSDANVTFYGMTNIKEFVAEAFTNPNFQARLAGMKLPVELRRGKLRSYWDAFLDRIGKIFGFTPDTQNYLTEIMRSGADLIQGADKNDRLSGTFIEPLNGTPEMGVFGTKGLSLEPMDPKKEIQKKGLMPATFEQVRDFKLDRRPMEEIIKDNLEGKELTDITPDTKEANILSKAYDRLGSLVKQNLLQDRTIALLMKNNLGTGPLIKWAVDKIAVIDREYRMKTKELTDHALKPFRHMFWNKEQRADLDAMREIWMRHVGVRDLDRADFKTDKQFEVYKGFKEVHDSILKDINEKREQHGFKAIDRIPSYFHALWEGEYRLFGHDAAGKKVFAVGVPNEGGRLPLTKIKFGGERIKAKMETEHPDVKWSLEPVTKDKYGLTDLGAFDDAIRVMSKKDDPVVAALIATYRDIAQHRGFGRTGLHKTGVKGALGTVGKGEKTTFDNILGLIGVDVPRSLMNTEKAFAQYVEQAHRYMGNLDKQLMLDDFQKIPVDIRKKIPQTMDFLYSYVHTARGARPEVWYDKMIGDVNEAVGLGRGAHAQSISDMSGIASIYWLFTSPRFLIVNSVQSINALPKLMQAHGTVDGTKHWVQGWSNLVTREKSAMEAIEWASKRQYLDPTIKTLIQKDANEVPTASYKELAKEVATWPAAWQEHNMVRAPVFLMFESALREKVKDKETRFEEAAEMADYYMVNYGRVHAPQIFNKMGSLGEAARPFKSYSFNYIGQFLEHASHAKNKGEYAPLATFFGTQVAVSGLKGMLFVAEATIAVNAINYLFDSDIPTPEQLLLKSGLHDALTYGGLSTVLNVDVSSSAASPGLPSMMSLPPIEFTKTMVQDVGNYAMHYIHGTETDQDRLRAWMAITPFSLHEWLKNLYTKEGQPTANPNDSQLRGNYRRSDIERIWSDLTGAKPLNEAKADALIRNVRKELMRDAQRKIDAIDAITDRVQNKQPIDPQLIQKYVKQGGDPANLAQSIMNRMKERMQTGVERYQDHTITPSQAHKLEQLRQYIDKSSPNPLKDGPLGFSPITGNIQPIAWDGMKQDMQDRLSMMHDKADVHPDTKMMHPPFKDIDNTAKFYEGTKKGITNKLKKPTSISM